ncbi:MAG: dihydrofolate reductase [Bacteroidota bacterium]|jgi:dihydrofolate reductase|nr:dihydrofolate reductase [Bacteroidales bacterium]MDI9535189.1 dihydrofolate reductase [Bacteroidota bacterium]OQC45479.1 MAG: Dihydrofolate reductase [Bacteroidetes bacterium ADurb.Bin028]NLP19228.1 dihydrofolate reductase [Bacteroidales bacterium]HNY43190.1 dihydrofolate reductase [Bacteroidales bacterium]
MSFSIIAAVAENYAIGKDNDLLCHLPGDLKRFKQITSGNTVIMGRKTFLSLPNGALPNRRNIVISRSQNLNFKNVEIVASIGEAIKICDADKENFIIGGGEIYKQFLPFVDKIYLTKIHAVFDGDTFFPELNCDDWNVEIEAENTEHEPNFSYINLTKK